MFHHSVSVPHDVTSFMFFTLNVVPDALGSRVTELVALKL